MNRLRHTHIYTLLLILGTLLTCTSCVRDYNSLEGDETGYVLVQFDLLHSLRANGLRAGNSTEELDNKLQELRMIVFPEGENASVINLLATDQQRENKRIIFKLSKLQKYDFYFIANESASGQKGSDLAFLDNQEVILRSQLEEMKTVKAPNIVSEKELTGVGTSIMMTALYKGALISESLQGAGTQSSPYIVDLTKFNEVQRPNLTATNRAPAELMRSLAKVELTLKGIVAIRTKPGSTASNPQYNYSWVLPYGYKESSKLLIEILNMPKSYTLFPSNRLTDIATVGTQPPYQFSFNGDPNPDYIVPPTMTGPSIGGIYMGDYKITLYLPEYLASSQLAEAQRPAIKITYQVAGSDDKLSKIYPIQNGTPASTDYETVLAGLTDRPDWNVYRNRFYQIQVNIMGKQF